MSYTKTIVVGLLLFGLVVLTALSTFYVSLGKCPADSLACDKDRKCVPQKLVCNFVRDCEDGQDENATRCGNIYGSDEVIKANTIKGIKIFDEFNATYNFSNDDEYWDFCLYERGHIPKGCECRKVNMITCINKTELPEKFPADVGMIELYNNSISLRADYTFESYRNLSYLYLGYNNISFIPSSLLSNMKRLRKLFLRHNRIKQLPKQLFNDTKSIVWLLLDHNLLHDLDLEIFSNLKELQFLVMSYNNLTLKETNFPELPALNELFLDNNSIENIDDLFSNLSNLTLISLRVNRIKVVKASTFNHLHRLKELRLSDNPVHTFDSELLLNLPKLNALYLDNLRIPINEQLVSKLNVEFLSIRGISYKDIDFRSISQIKNLKYVVFKHYNYCSMEPKLNVSVCRPKTDGLFVAFLLPTIFLAFSIPPGISSADLLMNPTLRYAAWIMALLTCIGNSMVLWGRFTFRDENRSVSMVIRNLAVADLIMGFYLAILSLQDLRYRQNYDQVAAQWVQSWGCALAGVLSMVSSEVSILILTFMSIERFLLISDPFGHQRLNTKNVMLSLYVIWLIGVSIAILPVILLHSSTKFYGVHNGGTCFPLFIHDKYSSGWEYSAFIFLGINLTLLLLIATLYSALFVSIWRTRRATTLEFCDCEFAIRFFFIVLTDSMCWAPIIILKFLAFTDFEVSGDAYAWLVVFILPLNSAVNPLLYTFSTPKYRDQIYTTFSKQSFSKKQDSNSHQVTAEDSQTKALPLSSSSSTNSSNKWTFLRKKS